VVYVWLTVAPEPVPSPAPKLHWYAVPPGDDASVKVTASGALPLVLMTLLIVAVGAFATVRQDAFLTSFNLNNLLLLTMPLALVSLASSAYRPEATPAALSSSL